jgi:hypothetical protein
MAMVGTVMLTPSACGRSDASEAVAETVPATEMLDRAIQRMGGVETLRGIERVRYDMITQWDGLNYAGPPHSQRIGYETHTDVRDYTIDAWRNTRSFGTSGRSVVDVVRGDAAIRSFGEAFQPLNVAYVDERDELFAYTPDRLVLALRDAADLTALPDSTIAGAEHARVRGTVRGLAMTLSIRRSTGLPTMVEFRAAQPNDFGLVPWGEMDVTVWYSGWSTTRDGISLPTQWSVERLGQLYKRTSIRDVTFNPDFSADSFAISGDLATAFRETASKPMHDLPLDSARVEGDLVSFRTFGAPIGAVRVGGGWLLLEAGQAPLSTTRALDWLAEHADGDVVGAVVTTTNGNGGVATLVERGIPVYTGPGLAEHVAEMLRNQGRRDTGYETISAGRWIASGPDSAFVAPVDLPDHPGGLALYVPSRRWMYTYEAAPALNRAVLIDAAAKRGWAVERMGTGRGPLEQPLAE